MTAIFLSLATMFSTLAGGLFTLSLRQYLRYFLGFAAGVLLGVFGFEVMPEIFHMAHDFLNAGIDGESAFTDTMIALVAGFILFHAIEKFFLVHHSHEAAYAEHHHPEVGVLSAIALIGHSFMDGVGIGLGFQVSSSVGIAVAIAVITHDFCDGLNTVSLMLAHANTARRSFVMLILDAIAPVIGAASTLLFHLPPFVLMLYLGFFAGFILYISVSDILPEAHSGSSPSASVGLIGLTCLGLLFVYAVAHFTH